jgi:hypothetical protein
MFVKVETDKLVMNQRYRFEMGNRVLVGYYKGTGDSVSFVYRGIIYEVLPYRSFYRFVSDNPRGQMERRSLNMILRRLIGDECFEW